MRPESIICVQCGQSKEVAADGPVPRYCSAACRRTASHQRSRQDGRYRQRLVREREKRQARRVTEAKPCPYCGDPMTNTRRVQCGKSDCKREHNNAKQREFQRRWKAERGQYHSRRYPEDLEKKRERDRRREAEMPGRKRYKESSQARDQRRRARKRGATVEYFTPKQVYERDGWTCQLCGEPVDREAVWPAPQSVTLDHVVPLARGGAHSMANTQCAHWACNRSKGAKLINDAA